MSNTRAVCASRCAKERERTAVRKRSLALRAWFLNDLPVFSNASYQKRGCEDPKRGAQDPDPDDGALKIAPSDGGALGILCLGRGRRRSRPVRWGAEDLSAPAGTTQILAVLKCSRKRRSPDLDTLSLID